MRLWLLVFGISSLVALCAFAADPLVLQTPAEMSACLPVTFTWTGGTSPYSLFYHIGSGAVGDETYFGAPILIGQTKDTQMTFDAPDNPNEAVKFILVDQENMEQDAWFLIQPSDRCTGPHPYTSTTASGGPSTVIHIPPTPIPTAPSTLISSTLSWFPPPSQTTDVMVTSDGPIPSQGPLQSGTSEQPGAPGSEQSSVQGSMTAAPGHTSQSPGQSLGGVNTSTRSQSAAAPFRSQNAGNDDTSRTPISSQARNAIIGTIVGGLFLLSGLFCWQWRRRHIARKRQRTIVPVLPRPSSWRDDEQGIMSERPGQAFVSLTGVGSSTTHDPPQTPGTARRIAPEISEGDLQAMMALHASSLNSEPSRSRAQSRAPAPVLSSSSTHNSSSHRPNIITDSQTRPTPNPTRLSSSVPTTPDSPSAPVRYPNEALRSAPLPSLSPKARREFGRHAGLPHSPSSIHAASMQALAPSTIYSLGETASVPSVRQVGQAHTTLNDTSAEDESSHYPDDSSHDGESPQAPDFQSPSYTAHQDTGDASLQSLIAHELGNLFTQNHPAIVSVDASEPPAFHPASSKSQNAIAEASSQPHRRLQVVNAMGANSSRAGVSDSEEDNIPATPSSAAPSSGRLGHAARLHPTLAPISPDPSHYGGTRRLVMSRQDMECLADLVAARIQQGQGSRLSSNGSTGTHGAHTLQNAPHHMDEVSGPPPPSYG